MRPAVRPNQLRPTVRRAGVTLGRAWLQASRPAHDATTPRRDRSYRAFACMTLLGAAGCSFVPRFTAWISPLLLVAAHGAAIVALAVLVHVLHGIARSRDRSR